MNLSLSLSRWNVQDCGVQPLTCQCEILKMEQSKGVGIRYEQNCDISDIVIS